MVANQLTGTAALRAVLHLGVLNHIPKDASATTKDLAGTLKVEEEILSRCFTHFRK